MVDRRLQLVTPIWIYSPIRPNKLWITLARTLWAWTRNTLMRSPKIARSRSQMRVIIITIMKTLLSMNVLEEEPWIGSLPSTILKRRRRNYTVTTSTLSSKTLMMKLSPGVIQSFHSTNHRLRWVRAISTPTLLLLTLEQQEPLVAATTPFRLLAITTTKTTNRLSVSNPFARFSQSWGISSKTRESLSRRTSISNSSMMYSRRSSKLKETDRISSHFRWSRTSISWKWQTWSSNGKEKLRKKDSEEERQKGIWHQWKMKSKCSELKQRSKTHKWLSFRPNTKGCKRARLRKRE